MFESAYDGDLVSAFFAFCFGALFVVMCIKRRHLFTHIALVMIMAALCVVIKYFAGPVFIRSSSGFWWWAPVFAASMPGALAAVSFALWRGVRCLWRNFDGKG